MFDLRAVRLVGGLIGVTGLITIFRSRKTRRVTADRLMKMNEREFDAFVRKAGLKTVSTARLSSSGDSTD